MRKIIRSFILLFLPFVLSNVCFAQSGIRFEQNKGQWDNRILYMARLENGFVFVQDEGLLFTYSSLTPHAHSDLEHQHNDTTYLRHAFLLKPMGMMSQTPEASELLQGYSNYFIGSDKSKWKSNVPAYGSILYKNVYNGIDWRVYGIEGELKHEFVLKPQSEVSDIRLLYSGVQNKELRDGNLILTLAFGEVVEQKPYAYQLIDGRKVEVEVSFELFDDAVGYVVGNYDRNKELVIDPALIFSTYSGSTADNWGFTATYDDYGNLYSGSIVEGIGYPTTIGAFSDYFSGIWDCAVTKFSADGSQMLYSTYFGGDYSEMPHSMIVNSYDELVVFGTTGSFNFPTTDGAYQRYFSQGTTVSYDGTVLFPHGVDIYVTRFSTDGTEMKASTYVGGSGNDGLNYRERYNMSSILTYVGNDSLYANYGDGARGELITDDRNNIYVGSSTFSTDFPTTASAFQSTLGGEQDGIVFKLDYTLGTLIFSSYFGGSGDDAVFSIDTDSEYRLYVTGGTVSNDFPTTTGAYSTTHNGGAVDAFLALVSYDGSQLLRSTYFGSDAFDLSYFVRTDRYNNPHIFGQTKASGTTLVYNAQYNIPNSGQFITKFNPNLDSIEFSTVFGTGNNQINISPTGFSVDVCGRIYISGWGRLFKYLPNLPSVFGTRNMQLTPNAYQSQTDGQDFYIMSMSSDASSLEYATMFGEVSATSNHGIDHVDGGTSRFDKYGNLYQVVCASCSGTQGFPIAPDNAWSSINPSSNCNAAAFKFNIHSDFAVANFRLPDYVCYPDSVRLENLSRGDNYLWLFGDGTMSTEENPVHYYAQSGTYDITLISYMNGACRSSDTLTQRIILLDSQVDTLESKYVCNGELVQIGVNSYPQSQVQFQWTPASGLSNANVPNPYASVDSTTTYRLVISTPQCSDTLIQNVIIRNLTLDLPDTVNYCNYPYQYQLPTLPESYEVSASWNRNFVDSLEVSNGMIQIDTTLSAWLYINIKEENCFGEDSIYMNYNGGWVQIDAHSTRCNNENNGYALITSGNFTEPLFYSWSTGQNGADLDSLGGLTVGDYSVTLTDFNGCTYSSTFTITSPDDLLSTYTKIDNPCQSSCVASIDLTISGGVAPYQITWSNGMNTEDISLLCSGEYIYSLIDSVGCMITDTVSIIDLDTLILTLNATKNNCPEGCSAKIMTQISGGTMPYLYTWSEGSTSQHLTDVCCGEYSLVVSDANNCSVQAEVEVEYIDAFANFNVEASETRVFDGHQILLSATPIAGMSYTWTPSEHLNSPFSASTIATMYETTVFYVYVTDNRGCNLKDSVMVEVDVVNCGEPNIYVPNIFTPNNDGKNDKVYVSGEWIDRFSFEIFDRWGEKVFATNDIEEGWDGTFNGVNCDAAVYFYKLEVYCQGGKTYITGGDITLIR